MKAVREKTMRLRIGNRYEFCVGVVQYLALFLTLAMAARIARRNMLDTN